MFGNLFHGKYSLKETFWKYAFLWVFIISFITCVFKILLKHKIGNIGLVSYYTNVFSFLKMDNMALFLTIAYGALFLACLFYFIVVIFGVFRSSAEYEKSVWMRHIARILTLVIVYYAFLMVRF